VVVGGGGGGVWGGGGVVGGVSGGCGGVCGDGGRGEVALHLGSGAGGSERFLSILMRGKQSRSNTASVQKVYGKQDQGRGKGRRTAEFIYVKKTFRRSRRASFYARLFLRL